MKTVHILVLIGAGLALAACDSDRPTQWGSTPTKWDHASRSVQEQQADQSECHARASYQTEREVEADGPYATEHREQLQQMFDRHDQAMHERAIYDNCLRDKGYVPVVLGSK
jgi:hypothetical protein